MQCTIQCKLSAVDFIIGKVCILLTCKAKNKKKRKFKFQVKCISTGNMIREKMNLTTVVLKYELLCVSISMF